MTDIAGILARADLKSLIESYGVALKPDGKEYKACCPFHDERTPSFCVVPAKGFAHCFGCGVHVDAIGFVMRWEHCDFLAACEKLNGGKLDRQAREPIKKVMRGDPPDALWIPISPVSAYAPPIVPGICVALWNPKKNREWKCNPSRVDEYRDASGRLIGYVLRIEFDDGKITPQITWCIGPDGQARWCARPFMAPRPMQGLDAIAAKPNAPVLIVEGEKCRAASAGALPMYAVAAWPGGSQGIRFVDFSALVSRDVVLWPDADEPGRQAMLGSQRYDGRRFDGVAQFAARAGAKSIRMVDPHGMPKGWDLADALAEGWTPKQLAVWAATRVVDVDVQFESLQAAA